MKRRILLGCLAIVTGLTTAGCDQMVNQILYGNRPKPVVKAPAIQKIKSPELAQQILHPVKHELDVTKDPFRPLIEKQLLTSDQSKEIYNPSDLEFIGVIKMQEEYMALLKVNAKKELFRVHDKIKNYTIEDIQHDRVVLNNGTKSITLKRGE